MPGRSAKGAFEPEHVGKMSFYLSAVDELLRDPAVDQPTLGSSLCRDKNRLVAEYALRDNHKPIGVAGWETKLVESLPKNLRGSLPTIEELEAELSREPAPVQPPKRRRRTDAGTTRQPAALWGRVDLAESAKREAAIRENLIGLGFGWPNG